MPLKKFGTSSASASGLPLFNASGSSMLFRDCFCLPAFAWLYSTPCIHTMRRWAILIPSSSSSSQHKDHVPSWPKTICDFGPDACVLVLWSWSLSAWSPENLWPWFLTFPRSWDRKDRRRSLVVEREVLHRCSNPSSLLHTLNLSDAVKHRETMVFTVGTRL